MPAQRVVCNIAKIANDRLIESYVEIKKKYWRDGLVIRTPNWLGDAVMSLPAIKLFRSIVPRDCAIFAVTTKTLSPLFSSLDCIDNVIELPSPHSFWGRPELFRLSRSNCGVGILLNNSFRDAFYFRLAMPFGRIYANSARGNSLFLSRSFHLNSSGLCSKGQHHASKYLSLAYAFGAQCWDGSFPNFLEIKEPEITSIEVLELANAENLLVIAPGAAYGPSKKWSSANFAKICRWWTEKNGFVVILGTKDDIATANEIEIKAKSAKIANLTGKTDIPDLIRILKMAKICVANDSGIMHLAASVGCAGVGVFGSTNPFATSPLSEKWVCLYSGLECSPCFRRECRYGHYNCLEEIKVDCLIDEIQKLLFASAR